MNKQKALKETKANKNRNLATMTAAKKSSVIKECLKYVNVFVESQLVTDKAVEDVSGNLGAINMLWLTLHKNLNLNTLEQVNHVQEVIYNVHGWKIKRGKGSEVGKDTAPKKLVQFWSNIKRAFKPQSKNGLILDKDFNTDNPSYDLFVHNETYQDLIKNLDEVVQSNKGKFFNRCVNTEKDIKKGINILGRAKNEKKLEQLDKDLTEIVLKYNLLPAKKSDTKSSKANIIKNDDVKKVKAHDLFGVKITG